MKKFKTIYMVWGLMVITILGLLTYLGFMYQQKLEPYKTLEKDLMNIAEKYVEQEFLYPKEGESIKISLEQLRREGLLEELVHNDDKCDGYVELKYNGVYNYKAYIKCLKYATKGY